MLEISSEHKNEAEGKNRDTHAKILVVDDDVGMRETLKEILTQEGYKTMTAQTGQEAIEACQKESFDVALIDIKLPDMEGTNLLDMLRKFEPTMIRIIITGYPSLDNAVQSLNSGADGYIVKPFKPVKLIEQIKEQLERRQKAKWENLLKKTGLSVYEAKIYLSLTLEGCSEVRKLSMSSGVPRTKAYAALKKLTQRGIVLEIPGNPQKFEVATPSDAFSTFVQSWKRELSEQAKVIVELEDTLSILASIHEEKQISKPVSMRKEEVWSIQEGAEIKRRTGEMLSRARTSVCAITTEIGLVLFHKNFGKVLDDLAEKGVKIRIKVPVGSSNTNFVHELRYAYKVENMQVLVPIFFLIVNENELLLANLKTDDLRTVSIKEFGLFFQGGTLGSFFSELLGFGKQEELSKKH
jgi:CheY-like chemotaxis protein/sugar-specific transcriptional regulator TrmB